VTSIEIETVQLLFSLTVTAASLAAQEDEALAYYRRLAEEGLLPASQA
jgi:hypothetical protein